METEPSSNCMSLIFKACVFVYNNFFAVRLQNMQKRCDEEMLNKFGQIRPVEELEFYHVDPRVDSLRQELKQLEVHKGLV